MSSPDGRLREARGCAGMSPWAVGPARRPSRRLLDGYHVVGVPQASRVSVTLIPGLRHPHNVVETPSGDGKTTKLVCIQNPWYVTSSVTKKDDQSYPDG